MGQVFDRILKFLKANKKKKLQKRRSADSNGDYHQFHDETTMNLNHEDTDDEKTGSVKLNNIIFKSPISPSMKFKAIKKKYGPLFFETGWFIVIDKRDDLEWLIVENNEAKHARTASTNLLKSQKTFDIAE